MDACIDRYLTQGIHFQDVLERSLEEQKVRVDQSCDHGGRATPGSGGPNSQSDPQKQVYDVLSFFAKELQRFNDRGPESPASQAYAESTWPNVASSRKRRRPDDETPTDDEFPFEIPIIPSEKACDILLRVYFSHVHPWIPMIHEGRLRKRLRDAKDRRCLEVVLRAMVLAVLKYVPYGEICDSPVAELSPKQSQRVRDQVVSIAMNGLSVENLQALIIIAVQDVRESHDTGRPTHRIRKY